MATKDKFILLRSMKMLTSIVIVGRPNVGKSTLFNKLTRTRSAIVSDHPGLTRDRQYGIVKINEQEIIIIDTGGITKPETPIEILMEKQTKLALQEAQIILFMVDAKSGLTPSDETWVQKLRKLNKTILVVVNKIDGQNPEIAHAEFHKLGLGESIAISAEHNIGISELKTAITNRLPTTSETEDLLPKQDTTKITFIGRPNVGKSTLVNRILGEERMIVHNQPGTTRDSVFVNFKNYDKNYTLVDTAGVRRRSRIYEKVEKFSIVKTLQAISATDVVVFLIDATENITDQDLKLLGFILEKGKALVIAVNKWDNLSPTQRDKIKSELKRRLDFLDFAKIYFISALHGTEVGNLFKAIDKAYLSSIQKLSTPELNRILKQALQTHQPPLAQGREIKLLYTHAGHKAPPTIIIHGTRVNYLPESYRRYLEHFFRKALTLVGTPVRIIFKNSR